VFPSNKSVGVKSRSRNSPWKIKLGQRAMNASKSGDEDSMLLQIHDLHKSFGGVHAINDLNFSVPDGEVLGIIGPNGSGKTTLFNVISGLTGADHGTILWSSQNIEIIRKKPWEVYNLGITRTFQAIRLPLGLSSLENVLIGLYMKANLTWTEVFLEMKRLKDKAVSARKTALEALDFMGKHLAEFPDRLISELSYPDRRRVEIARAIVSKPRLILLDEPTAGMNPSETDEIKNDIVKVNSSGISIIVIEHKVKFVSEVAKHIIVLNFGKKIAEGSYEDIRKNENVIEAYLGRKSGVF
jgi:ABC-type branched-subunit amino acid transport system ATPase component